MKNVAAGLLVLSFLASADAEQRNPFESDEAAIRIGSALFAHKVQRGAIQ